MPDIQTFIGDYIAIYRMRKKTYSVLKYNHELSRWIRHDTTKFPITNMNVNYQTIEVANVNINIGSRVTNPTYVQCKAHGSYINARINNQSVRIVIIIKKTISPNDFPLKTYKFEFQCTENSQLPATTLPLWTLYVAPVVPPPPPPPTLPPLPPMILRRQMSIQIPQRIAWIIAEDACNKGETCPITMEPIIPITSAVTSCYHVFEKNALDEWFKNNSLCPLCKQDVTMTACYTPTITESTS